jgi:hypothetical protein
VLLGVYNKGGGSGSVCHVLCICTLVCGGVGCAIWMRRVY